jgi:hypothetical protein
MAVYRDVYPEAVAFLEEHAEIARAIGDRLTESGALIDLREGRRVAGERHRRTLDQRGVLADE